MAFARQLGLLLWKNFVLQKRKVCVSIFEVILPLLFAVIVLVVRILTTVEDFDDPIHYPSEPVAASRTNLSVNLVERRFLFTPNHPDVVKVMEDVRMTLLNDTPLAAETLGFDTEEQLLNYYVTDYGNVSHAIVFKNVTSGQASLPNELHFSIRPKPLPHDDLWFTSFAFPFQQQNVPRSNREPDYWRNGFLYLQRIVGESIIRLRNPAATSGLSEVQLNVRRMPYPPYTTDPMIGILQLMFPLFLILSFLLNAIQTTKNIVYEKERKLKETMKLMGLNSAAHWSAWFLTTFIYTTVAMALYTLLFSIPVAGKSAVLANSDPSLFFVFLLVYSLSLISFCFMISVFVQRANVGGAVAGILYFLFYFPYNFVTPYYQDMTRPQKMSACLLFNMAMAFGGYTIGLYEGTSEGVQWSNIGSPASVDDNFSLLDSMIMMLVDTVIHLLITWYLDNVYPGEYGVARPWYFPFTRSYWCGPQPAADCIFSETKMPSGRHFESEPTSLETGVEIRNLTKVFGTGSRAKKAVDGISLNMYKEQITVVLGHNGAGKTTTMSMLTGFLPTTSGTARVNGFDINTDIDGVRQSLGLCPQHNIMFDNMTVSEHLQFFARIKGCPDSLVDKEVDDTIRDVGLELKRYDRAVTLSGGQKRKLSLGIALIAGSKVVILDEPTSGMDPAARHQAWEVLRRNKDGRTIVLTTHFMDEADILGDRIAIMAEGVIKCCGTSMFLKKTYGAGYHLTIVFSDGCDVARVTSTVQSHVTGSYLESQTAAELRYLLPDDQSQSFPALFRELDSRQKELAIGSYGTSATTMEEVFLKVGESAVDDDDDGDDDDDFSGRREVNGILNPVFASETNGVSHDIPQRKLDSIPVPKVDRDFLDFNRHFVKVQGIFLELSRFRGMFVKKMLHSWRNRILTIVQVILPVVMTIVGLAVTKAAPNLTQEPSLDLDLAPFQTTVVPFSPGVHSTPDTDNISALYAGLFQGTSNRPEKMTDIANATDDYFLDKIDQMGIASFNKHVIIAGEFVGTPNASDMNITARYNGQPYHSVAIAVNFVMDSLVKFFAGSQYSLAITNDPLPKNLTEKSKVSSNMALSLGFTIGYCIVFGMAFLTSGFVHFLIKERSSGAKHLQVVSGVGPLVFWTSNLAWDYINYLIPCLLILPVFAAFNATAFIEGTNMGVVFLLLLLFGCAILPCMYILQYLFTTPATGMVLIIILNILTGGMTTAAVFILQIPSLGTKDVGDALDWVFLILFPNFGLGKAIMDMSLNKDNKDFCDKQQFDRSCPEFFPHPCCRNTCGLLSICLNYVDNYLAWEAPGVGRYVFFLAVQSVVFGALTLAIEYQLPQKFWYMVRPPERNTSVASLSSASDNEDDDVLRERSRIMSRPVTELPDSLVLDSVYKRYGHVVVVDHISVGIQDKVCFGLLGQNGAGKTTTFKMLTGDVMVTGGNAFLMGYDVKSRIKKVQENMGYCPQFDALIDQMTGRETLTMFARLRGVPETSIPDVVRRLIDIMMLQQYADKETSKYSGGNKRKLSTAISLIGDPAFILLDEPSTGMDPRARRQLWTVLSKVRDSGRSLVLTSHSMEECDALCTNIAIMVNGRFVCLGTPQHLKTKFAQGYTIIVHVNEPDPEIAAPSGHDTLTSFLQQRFQKCSSTRGQQGYLWFQIKDPDVPLADVFEVMEETKKQFPVQDYSVHQTTLEQVFLSFTSQQVPPKEDKTSILNRIFCC